MGDGGEDGGNQGIYQLQQSKDYKSFYHQYMWQHTEAPYQLKCDHTQLYQEKTWSIQLIGHYNMQWSSMLDSRLAVGRGSGQDYLVFYPFFLILC